MKKIILLLLTISGIAFAQVTSRTSIFSLPQWTAGNKLYAGTIGDSATTNDGINSLGIRVDAILGRQINGSGLFNSIYGAGAGNLSIDAGYEDTVVVARILLLDSLYGYYNWTTEGDISADGNLTIGGYISADSLLGQVSVDTLMTNNIMSRTRGETINVHSYGAADANNSFVFKYNNAETFRLRYQTSGLFSYYGFYDSIDGFSFYNTVNSTVPAWTIPDNGTLSVTGKITVDTLIGEIVMDGIYPDSVSSPTVSYKLWEQPITSAGASNSDTSNFTSTIWQQDTTRNSDLTYKRKAKFLYVHKSGITNLKAYYQAEQDGGSFGGFLQVKVRTIGGTLVSTTTSSKIDYSPYESTTTSASVSGLTNSTPYFIELSMRDADNGSFVRIKELIIMAESQ